MSTTCHVVVHPVQHDLRCTVPTSGHVSGHLVVSVPCQAKVQNLGTLGGAELKAKYYIFLLDAVNEKRCWLTFSSQSSFTAKLPGFKSCRGQNHKVDKVQMKWLGDEQSLHSYD